jgi:septum site-determining protein MinC
VAHSARSREVLYREGVPVRESVPEAAPERRAAARADGREGRPGAYYLRRSLRSGQKEVSEHDVVVVGDVNQGAEVLAGGDVIVFGSLRGVVHAGYPDNTEAVVIALRLIPLQLRIGRLIARPEEGGGGSGGEGGGRGPRPEIARVRGQRIVIEPFLGKA